MALGLVPGVRTQGISWSFQEVHHCDTHILVTWRQKIGRIYTALTTKLLMCITRTREIKQMQFLPDAFQRGCGTLCDFWRTLFYFLCRIYISRVHHSPRMGFRCRCAPPPFARRRNRESDPQCYCNSINTGYNKMPITKWGTTCQGQLLYQIETCSH